ncbi:MAG: hypothetical protein JRG86_03500, partial [Deltaproteobacteria bacterium]|nr:hypothetical protein [Deltaproteobacteria bacterium]
MERGTVVLLHGLARSAAEMRILEWRLRARGYRVWNIDYSTRVACIEEASDAVFTQLEGHPTESPPIHFVTEQDQLPPGTMSPGVAQSPCPSRSPNTS